MPWQLRISWDVQDGERPGIAESIGVVPDSRLEAVAISDWGNRHQNSSSFSNGSFVVQDGVGLIGPSLLVELSCFGG